MGVVYHELNRTLSLPYQEKEYGVYTLCIIALLLF